MSLNLGRGLEPGDAVPAPGNLRVVINLKTNNSRVNLEVTSCCLSPTTQPHLTNSTCCLFSRLAAEPVGITVLPSALSSSASFTISLFQMINYSVVYLHCDLSVCLRNRSDCERECLQQRSAFTLESPEAIATNLRNRISFGPMLKEMKNSTVLEAIEPPELDLVLIIVSLVVGSSLVTVLLLLVWLAYRRRAIWPLSSAAPPRACCGCVRPGEPPAVPQINGDLEDKPCLLNSESEGLVSERISVLMDHLADYPGQFRNFNKDDFEADWIKVAECRFGQVYQVKFKLWRERCALKCFDTTFCSNSFYRRIIEEASGIVTVRFKYITSVYGLCNEAAGVVMEYMSNGSLNNLLATHTLMWPKKLQMIHEASMGMNFLHSMNPPLLHLNLKTSNILLDDHLHVKISDFGLIHWKEGMCKKLFMEHLTARGNISYIPPETFTQCPDPPGITFDVYSFGIVIWEILSQQKPYAGWNVTTVLLQVSNGKRPCMDMIAEHRPNECDRMISIMQQCWDQDHRRRPLFSDILLKTEALSEIIKIPGTTHCQDEEQNSHNPWLSSPVQKIALLETPDLPSDDQSGRDVILSLMAKKDFGSFREFVKREHVLTQFSGGRNILHHTVASGDADSVKHVLSLGAEVNCSTARGYTPLIFAVLYRLHDIISLLLEHGAAANQGDEDQWTALHFAAQSGDDRAVRLLLDKGAVADAREKSGWMPLHLACQNGHETVVRLLLSRLSEEAVREWEEAQGRTPLHLASAYGHLNIAKLLLTKGADPNATDSSLLTALHLSADEGNNRLVRHLLKSGANIDSADSRGYTPLHLAALKGHRHMQTAAVKWGQPEL
ncbi:hypothetical protein Q5P01_010214 [Channa striata]|uniref:Ankyrin repeat and kinase domain containing 1 n=1 Tax=Channa striata TaxID=64152 RepID=A0AA88N432_CHASR|nr:hypothetical protein Q5P01_010214 [Channa striata]